MQKKQESKVKSARATLGILTGNKEIVEGTPGLGAATETLAILVEETAIHSQGQMNTGTEFTTRKNEARATLTVATLKICAALAAHATVSEDPAVKLLKSKYQVADTEVKRMRDMPLFTYASMVFADASPFAELLGPFATKKDVVGLKTLADNFNGLVIQGCSRLDLLPVTSWTESCVACGKRYFSSSGKPACNGNEILFGNSNFDKSLRECLSK